jgi:branched-chain amino acid transport system permease protein
MSDTVSLSADQIARRRFFPFSLGAFIFVAAAAGCAAIPLAVSLTGYQLNLLMQASTYTVAVFGLVIVLGYTGQINLAQAAFFGLGAYCVALGTTDFGLGFWLSLVLGVATAALAGAILGLASLRLGGHYLAMVTISFQTILSLALNNWISLTHGPDGVRDIKRPELLIGSQYYLAFCIAMFFIAGFAVFQLKRRRLGRAMQAVRDNELAAGVAGIDTFGTKVAAFTLSAALGGFGGGLFAGGFTYISPDQFTFAESIVFLTMALLGGAVSPFGAALGTGLLILLPEWLRFLKVVYLAVYGAAVILIMVFLPEGLWGIVTWARKRLFPPESVDVKSIKPLPLTQNDDRMRAGGRRASVDGKSRPSHPNALPKGRGSQAPLTSNGESLLSPHGERDGVRGDSPSVSTGAGILDVRALSKHFGGLKAVDAVDLLVSENSVHALIGPNGSGKTTMLNVLSGLYRPTSGSVLFDGEEITYSPPHKRARLGLGRTFQNIRLFPGMSVLDNVIVGAEQPGRSLPGTEAFRDHALSALKFVGLADRAYRDVGSLSYGHQRLVEIARALAANPKLILLDEPGAGLNHAEKDGLIGLLKQLKGHGLTILIIDHDMAMVEQVADHITVLNFGRRIADGLPQDVLRNPDVVAAYLGEVRSDAA